MAAKHSNKHIREAIRYALQHGWTFKVSSGHAFGRLYCPNHCQCQFSVWSTPTTPEKQARWIRRRVDRCPLPIEEPAAVPDQNAGDADDGDGG
jgi:hypothetical protein